MDGQSDFGRSVEQFCLKELQPSLLVFLSRIILKKYFAVSSDKLYTVVLYLEQILKDANYNVAGFSPAELVLEIFTGLPVHAVSYS